MEERVWSKPFSKRIRMDGPYRVIHLEEGYYVTGHKCLFAVESKEEGDQLTNELRRQKKEV